MKKMIKSALALVAAVVLGSSAWAADPDESCDVTMTVGVTSNMLAKLNVADADKANWVLHSSDKTVATVAWVKDDDNKNVVAITSVANGQAEVVARSPKDVEYTFNVYVSTVEMEKSIKADDGEDGKSNATIRVVTHVDCGKTDRTPRVLFIASRCGKHGLTRKNLADAVKVITEKADIDFYMFDHDGGSYGSADDTDAVEGWGPKTILRGSTDIPETTFPELSDPNNGESAHKNLKAYMACVTNKLDIASGNWAQYDYVILSFDRYRLTVDYKADPDLERATARSLLKFYKKNRVLWFIDQWENKENCSPYDTKDYTDENLFRPNSYLRDYAEGSSSGTKQQRNMNTASWEGYMALLDPQTYWADERIDGRLAVEKKEHRTTGTWTSTYGDDVYAGNSIEAQAVYSDSERMKAAINKYMKFPSFAAEAADKVVTAGGTMSIPEGTDSVTLWNWEGSGDPQAKGDNYMADDTGWEQEKDAKKQPKVDGNQVTCVVSNLNGSVWQKLEIKVRTTPEFMAEAIADAKGEQKFCKPNGDGTFKVNPNNGDATMELSRSLDGKKQGTLATGAAAAANAWIVELPEFEFTVSPVNRPYNKASTNVTVSVTDKDSREPLVASYYKLAYSTDDGTTWTTNTVADFYAAFTNVVDTTVAVKVVITGDDTYKPSDYSQSATLTITPLTVTVTAGNGSKTYDGTATADLSETKWTITGDYAVGETNTINALISAGITNNQGEVEAFVRKSGSADAGTYTGDITTNRVLTANQNYIVNFTPGTFTINKAVINGYDNGTEETKIPAWAWAKPVSIVTNDTPVGDGQLIDVETSLLKESDNPKFTYSVDGGSTWLEEDAARAELKDLCYEKKVWCKVECDNYYSTNVWAYVTIKERVTEVDDEEAGAWKPAPVPGKNGTDAALTAAAKKFVDKYGWEADQVTADAVLLVTASENLKGVDKAAFEKGTNEVYQEVFVKGPYKNYENRKITCFDVKVLYIKGYKDGSTGTNVETEVETPIPFTVQFADVGDLLEAYHCHGGNPTKLTKRTSLGTDPNVYVVDEANGKITFQFKEFSPTPLATGTPVPSPCAGICSWVDLHGADPANPGVSIVYDFTANLKTTVAKKGKATTYTVNLGMNEDKDFWWSDETLVREGSKPTLGSIGDYDDIVDIELDKYGNRKTAVFNKAFDKLSDVAKEDIAVNYFNYNTASKTTDFNVKSANRWCKTFKYTVDGKCYRVAGSKKITATYKLGDCCGAVEGGHFQDLNGVLSDLKTILLYRFGAQAVDKATKVEFVGQIADDPVATPMFYLAGQGALAKVRDSKKKDSYGITSMNGNIVGLIEGPTCADCCTYGVPSIAFVCDADDDSDVIPDTVTAAFGTFTIKYNQKKSVFPARAN